jgi:hypothetical protein
MNVVLPAMRGETTLHRAPIGTSTPCTMAITTRASVRALVLHALLATACANKAQAQRTTYIYDPEKYILVDDKMFRGGFGYAAFGISDVDTLPARLGQGVNTRIECRLASRILDRDEGFVIADAFFLDMTLGRMSSEPLAYYIDPESRFSVNIQFGYSFLAGYSAERYGLLAGKSFNWSSASVGGTSLPGVDLFTSTGPWMMRAEFRPAFSNEFRVMITGWDNFNDERRDHGFRVDIPFLPKRRLFLTYEYGRRSSDVSYVTFDNDQYAPGHFTQHLFGMRFGSIY